MEVIYAWVGEHLLMFQTDTPHVAQYIKGKYHILSDAEYEGRQPDLFVYLEGGYGHPFESFHVEITKDAEKISYYRGDYLLEVDPSYQSARIYVHDDYALKHALLNLYSSYIVHLEWGLVIHSSCVLNDERAYIFAGQSGAGKSTVARLSQPRPLLSDEATVVRITDDDVVIFDSPFRSELGSSLPSHIASLGGIHILYQDQNVQRTRIGKAEGILKLMDHVFYWSHDPEDTKKILRMYERLVRRVPIYDLHFPKNDTFWEAIS